MSFLIPYDTSTPLNPNCLSNSTSSSPQERRLLWPSLASAIESIIVWDSVYFIRIAQCSYEYEQTPSCLCFPFASPSSREQAILSIKKGAYLLNCGRRGKPKFCPFRLSTVSFQRQLQPEKEPQSFSLVYANGECSLDLICKDKAQADSWMLGLRVIISRCHHPRPFNSLRGHKGVQSCNSSPAGFIRRKHNLGLSEDATEFSEVNSCFAGGDDLFIGAFCEDGFT